MGRAGQLDSVQASTVHYDPVELSAAQALQDLASRLAG
ncbi:hypothetical protein C4K40_3486 [Pseudomonas sp. CMR5c]|nr:hypothetical protein C4K40_3486 [Pseudomonas sp. CMR5c]